MRPKKPESPPNDDLFRSRLDNMISQRHELVRLAELIDWSMFESRF